MSEFMQQFTSWEVLATFSGATAVTAVVVQFIKGFLDQFLHIPTQVLSYLVALLVLLAATFFTGQLDLSSAALIPLNAVIVSMASNGAYEGMSRIGRKGGQDG